MTDQDISQLLVFLSRQPLTLWDLYNPTIIEKANLFCARVLSPYASGKISKPIS